MSATYGSLPFTEAIDFLKQKVPMPSRRWEDFTRGMHARAFVVAGAAKSALVTDLFEEVNKGIAGKQTLQDFRKNFDGIVARHGWDYKGGRNWRTATIFQTNLSVAYATGRAQQRNEPELVKAFPYDRYRTMDDGRVRPEHQRWNNLILRHDDPWWNEHDPPASWGCRCWREPVSRGERDTFIKSDAFRETAPTDGTYEWRNPSTGQTETVPKGVDPGWNYNKGKAAWGEEQSREVMDDWARSADKWESMTAGDWRSAGRPELVPLDKAPAPLGDKAANAAGMRHSLEQAIGGDEAAYTFDRDGLRIDTHVVAQPLIDHIGKDTGRARFFPWLGAMLTDPFEIWASFERNTATGKVELRQRFLKAFESGAKGQGMVAVMQAVKGRLESWTVVPAKKLSYLQNQRRGKLLWGRR